MAVTINFNTLRQRASQFAKDFEGVTSEKKSDQDFMRGFCAIFGINPNRIDWQYPLKEFNKVSKKSSTIWADGVLRGALLIEMKSAGKDLDEAYIQASGYVSLMNDKDRPDYILVSDFANLHLYNRITGARRLELKLNDLPQQIEPFLFLANYEIIAIEQQVHINKEAAETMAKLHDAIKATGYIGKDLETYLVRLLFCLFAEDTGLFGENGVFLDYLINHTQADGSDLHGCLMSLFDTLNKPDDSYLQEHAYYTGPKRLKNLPEHRAKFPYINGQLFAGTLAECCFDEAARKTLIDCAKLDWSHISPAIFGSLFQAIMHFEDEAATAKSKKRREFGAHYTSEENILKVINPLFMDDLRKEFAKCGKTPAKLGAFHNRLAALNFFDLACGCGNFLVIAYRELRLLELEVIQKLFGNNLTAQLDVDTLIRCNVDQFHGIEIDDSAAQIATVALWLTDHQMNTKVQSLGLYYHRIPLVKKANIICANALRIDWNDVIPAEQCSFVMGNPPFVGAKMMTASQRDDIATIFGQLKSGGLLDYVAAWHIKATEFIKNNPNVPVAFVSTNSICQGEQVGVLWRYLLDKGVKIRFAYRTFKWSNEGRGIAAVHCIIIGFSMTAPKQYLIFDGENIIEAKNINPYLVNAPTVLIENRNKPICNVPKIGIGNKPIDGGNYLFTTDEKIQFIAKEPASESYFKRWLGAHEFINGYERWCLWLGDIEPNKLTKMPLSMERVAAVKQLRASSKSEPTRKIAATPTRFHVEFMPKNRYLLIPSVSSENRSFIPIGYIEPEIITSNLAFIIPNTGLYHFGVLTSTMHNAWMRTVCGRMKSDYRYSASIVYNNFPWATPDAQQIKAIEEKAQAVLDARAEHKTSTLADLYNPLTMPPNLLKAHNALDKAVDAAYGYKGGKDDATRVAFLFEQYQKLIALPQVIATKEPKTAPKKPMIALS